MSSRSSVIPVFIVVFLAFFLRLVLLPFAQVVDADAVTRIFMAQEWWESPAWISEGVWPPLHQYFYGLIVGLSGDHQTVPIIVTIALSSLSAIPMFHFIKREYNEKAAFWISLALVLSPVLFRNSYHTLSGTPFILLLLLAKNSLSKSWKESSLRSAIWAGVFMTLACGFRYEGWMLLAVFTGFGVLQKEWKTTVIFWSVAMIFPAFWMIGNYIAHQDLFFGLSGAYDWNIVQEGVNSYLPRDVVLLRWFFFPASWLFLFSPILALVLIWGLFVIVRRKQFQWQKWRWGSIFILLLVVFVYKSNNGTLLNQHRFTGTLIVFSLPLLAMIWELDSRRLLQVTKFGIISLMPLSFLWGKPEYAKVFPEGSSSHYALDHFRKISSQGMAAVPRLKNAEVDQLKDVMLSYLKNGDALVIDFIDWESSYYLAFESGVHQNKLLLVNGAKNAQLDIFNLRKTISSSKNGIFVVKKGSELHELINKNATFLSNEVKVYLLHDEPSVLIFRFEKNA
ncbi:MAG: ArnT family glycosyltransferase [Fluviicola sp.]